MATELALTAFHMALATRQVRPGLVHHSNHRAQYTSQAYTNVLKEHGIQINIGRAGNLYDNAQAERFLKILKYEEAYLFEYANLAEARARIGYFIEEV